MFLKLNRLFIKKPIKNDAANVASIHIMHISPWFFGASSKLSLCATSISPSEFHAGCVGCMGYSSDLLIGMSEEPLKKSCYRDEGKLGCALLPAHAATLSLAEVF